MNLPVRVPGYDLFKLIIVIILLLILFYLLWGSGPQTPSIETRTPTIALLPASSVTVLPSLTVVPAATISPALPTVIEIPSITPDQVLTPGAIPIIGEMPAEQSVCEAFAKSRLKVGMDAVTKVRLNFRLSPGIQNNRILTMPFNTKVAIIGGPTCTRYVRGAYLWWQIKLPDGRTGWSAEASLLGTYYFLEALP
jgi:hypothetical protein